MPGENDKWDKRYLKVLRRLGKGNKVEELMASITEDVQRVVNHNSVQSATVRQNLELDNIIKEMKSIESSVPVANTMTFSSGGGAQTNNVNSGSGQQITNSGHVGTQYFNSGKEQT